MSGGAYEAINVLEAGIGDQYPPQSTQTQATQGEPNFIDGSGPIFSMYLELAEEEDKKMVEGWKADADGILIFTGLFSAAVASLISVSIQDIRPSPQDTSNFYLANIYQTVADPNRFNISGSPSSSPPTFTAPNSAVWVNSLWFMSLVISLTCALLATLLQQWARRYLKVTQTRYSPHKRARIRAFFFEGVGKFLLPWAVEALPTLLHVSLFLFFAGLVVFLCNVNLTIFKLVLSWVGVCTALYGCITFMPIFRHDSPYYSPLSSLVWPFAVGILYVIGWVRQSFGSSGRVALRRLKDRYRKSFFQGMQRTAEETALGSPPEIDTRAFMWTFDSLDEDHELERFFSGLPGFRSSRVVGDPLLGLTQEGKWRIFEALIELLDHTFSSDPLPESVKNRRATICAKAINPAEIRYAYQLIITRINSKDKYRGLKTAQFIRIVRSWGDGGDPDAALFAQVIVSSIVAGAQRRDGSWFSLASNELGIPETVLRDYAAHGDSLSLAILIHVTRLYFSLIGKPSLLKDGFPIVSEAASKFNAKDTSLELQRDFCALWNQIVLKAQADSDNSIAWDILRALRNVYIALHQRTDPAPTQPSASTCDLPAGYSPWLPSSTYPLCGVPGHHWDPTPQVRGVTASTTFARAVLHDNAAFVPPSPTSTPDMPAPSVVAPTPLVRNRLAYVPPLDNISVPGSLRPAYQTSVEDRRIPATPPDPITIRMTQGCFGSFARPMPLYTPETSAYTPPFSSMVSTSLPGAVAVQYTADHRTSSDAPDVPWPLTPIPVLNAVPLTGPQSSLNSPVSRSDRAFSSPKSHSSVLAPSTPDLSPLRHIVAPDPGATTEGEGSAKAALRKGNDPLYFPSATREVIVTTPVLLPQSPSLPTDVATAGPPRRTIDIEHTRNHPLGHSHSWYDIV